jgi:hypothetical protein
MTDKSDHKQAAKRSRPEPEAKHKEELKAFETLSISDHDDESKGTSDDSVSTT